MAKTSNPTPVLVTGGTGFIGRALLPLLLEADYQPLVFSRQPGGGPSPLAGVQYLTHVAQLPDPLPKLLINLSGEGVADKRWSAARRRQLYRSRIEVTRSIVSLYRRRQQPIERVVSGSAVGFYGPHNDKFLNESGRVHDSFSHRLCQQWEAAAQELQTLGARVCLLRMGVVVGAGGGIVKRMRLPFKLGMGGVLGSGNQWMSWIDHQDLVRLLLFCLQHETLQGPVNATSPHPVTNREFTETLARCLQVSACLPMPAWLVSLLFGQMGEELLLQGQRVIPEVAQASGFEFKRPALKQAFSAALASC